MPIGVLSSYYTALKVREMLNVVLIPTIQSKTFSFMDFFSYF